MKQQQNTQLNKSRHEIFKSRSLSDLIPSDFCHSFLLLPNAQLKCLTNGNKIYELEELLDLGIINSPEHRASIYLITAPGNIRGTTIDYWEHH